MDLEIALLFKMGAVLLLLVLVLCGLRRMAAHRTSRGCGLIHIVESKAVGQSQTLYLVQVGEQSFLLGGSKESLSLLTEVANLALPTEHPERGAVDRWPTGKALADWTRARTRWLTWWRDRLRFDGWRRPTRNEVDQA